MCLVELSTCFLSLSAFRVVLGRHTSKTEQVMRFDTTDTGKYFFDDSSNHRHDIMLLKLPNKLSEQFPVINIPPIGCTSPKPPFTEDYTIIGWSYTATEPVTNLKSES